MEYQKPFLHFNFANKNGNIDPLTLSNPSKLIVAKTVEEVIPSLQKIENEVEKGKFAAGYLSYEAAPAFDSALFVKKNNQLPLLWFGIFDEPASEPEKIKDTFSSTPWKPSATVNQYHRNIDKIHKNIKQGITEQVNYTIQMKSEFSGDAFAFYNQLKEAQDAKYTAYLNTGDHTILSASPELFFRIDNNKITTKPMKGTVSRGKTYKEDLENAEWLQSSKKNQAENKLIVDLMHKDLGKIANPGTVETTKLFEIEKYPTVYQMTSTITANLSPKKSMTDIFKALFPCGSITGLPKKETMQVIADLETAPREVYCGAIGFITPKKKAVFNVPIRTVIIDNESRKSTYGVGGGITLKSSKEEEYKEVLAKSELLHTARPSFSLLETIGLFDGKYFVLKNHLKRLRESAAYFNYSLDIPAIRNELTKLSANHISGNYKVRLLVSKSGKFNTEIHPLNKPLNEIRVKLADKPVHKENVFLFHKTTNRAFYEKHKQHSPDYFDVLLWNELKQITEFTTGNIVVEMDGKLYTPPVTCGLLAGTFRNELLLDGVIKERILNVNELADCSKIWYVNSVRKWVTVHLEK